MIGGKESNEMKHIEIICLGVAKSGCCQNLGSKCKFTRCQGVCTKNSLVKQAYGSINIQPESNTNLGTLKLSPLSSQLRPWGSQGHNRKIKAAP